MTAAPRFRVREVRAWLRPVRTRMPFRYGTAVVTEEPILHVRIVGEDGIAGVSAAALPPLWFDKGAGRTHADDIRDLLRSLSEAARVYREADAADAWTLHGRAEPEARRRCAALGMNDLTAGFGVALLDAAVIDAICRQAGSTFHQGLREGLFGLVAPVGERPLEAMDVRHTVGMGDPLTAADTASRIGDGLPETLEEVVREYGVRYFKIKVSGDAAPSLQRLGRIAAVLDRDAGDYRVTLDGNEQFHSMNEVDGFVRAIEAAPALRGLWGRTLWIEQPVERGKALEEGVARPLRRIGARKPVILDESDGTDDAVDRGLSLGYGGISAKNCKGVFRTLHSHRRAREAGVILSSEDLMNIPVVPLHQDLCVAAALGIAHSERNGHHYIRAFEFFSPGEREAALCEFPSLYRDGPPRVRIEGGKMALDEINAFGFGVRSEPDWDFLQPVSIP